MPAHDPDLESQFDRRFAELEMRLAFQEQALAEMSDALAAARMESARNNDLLRRALDDLQSLRGVLDSGADPADEPPPPHY